MKKLVIGILISILCSSILLADHNQHLFEQANTLYETGKYVEAIQTYEEILSNGYESWELYYNLGNAYYKNRKLGRAILNYERAHRLAPKNEDILFNLELANLSVVDKITAPPAFFLFKIFTDFKNYFSINLLAIIVISSYGLIILFTILYILIRKKTIRRISLVFGVPVLFVLIVFAFVLALRSHEQKNLKYGIIQMNKVDVMSSPEENSTELFSLHEGVKIQVQKQLGEWLQIRLSDGKVGWVKQGVVEVI